MSMVGTTGALLDSFLPPELIKWLIHRCPATFQFAEEIRELFALVACKHGRSTSD